MTDGKSDKVKGKRGFAAMAPEERSRIARLGGIAVQQSGNAHRWNSQSGKVAGAKGGHQSRGGRGKVLS